MSRFGTEFNHRSELLKQNPRIEFDRKQYDALKRRPYTEFDHKQYDVLGRRPYAEFDLKQYDVLERRSYAEFDLKQYDVLERRSYTKFTHSRHDALDCELGADFRNKYDYSDTQPPLKVKRPNESIYQDNYVVCDRFEKFLPGDCKMQESSLTKVPETICREGHFNGSSLDELPIARGIKVFDSRLQIDEKIKSLNNEGWEIKLSANSSKLIYTLYLGVIQNLNVPEHALKKLNMLERVLAELNKKIGNNLSDKNEFIDQLIFGVLVDNSENLISKKINIIGACIACEELNKCGTMEMSIEYLEEIQILHVTINFKKDKKKMKIIDLGKFTNEKTNFKEMLFEIETQFQMRMMQQKIPNSFHLVRFIFPYGTDDQSEIEISEIKKKTEYALFTCLKKFSKCAKYLYQLTDKAFAVELFTDESLCSIETLPSHTDSQKITSGKISSTSVEIKSASVVSEEKSVSVVSEEKLEIQIGAYNPFTKGYQTIDDGVTVFYSFGIIPQDRLKGCNFKKIEYSKKVSFVQSLIPKDYCYNDKDKIIFSWCKSIYGKVTEFPIIENYGDDYYLVQFRSKSHVGKYFACLGLYVGEKKSINFETKSIDIGYEYDYEKTKIELLQRYRTNSQVKDKTKNIHNIRFIVKKTSSQNSYKIIVAILTDIAETLQIELNFKEIIEIIDEYIIISIRTYIMARYTYLCLDL
jgi:hypothetical protein